VVAGAPDGDGIDATVCRSACSSCVIVDRRTFVSSAFSRRTRTVSPILVTASVWSAIPLRFVAACSSSFVPNAFSASCSVPNSCCICAFCSCSIRMSAIIS